MKKTILAGLSWALFVNAQMHAQAITYLVSDNVCVRKHDYEQSKAATGGFYEFYVQSAQNANLKLVLRVPKTETGIYIANTQNLLPSATLLTCGDVDKLTPEFIDGVNGGLQILHVAEKTAKGYTLYQIQEINTYEETFNAVSYKNKSADFSYKFDSGYDNKADLANSGKKVMFQEARPEQCMQVRTFKVFGDNISTVQLLEGVGLYKVAKAGTEINLKSVNGQPLPAYLATMCNLKNSKTANLTKPIPVPKPNPTTKTETTTITTPSKPKTNPEPEKSISGSSSIFSGNGKLDKTHALPNQDKKIDNTNGLVARGNDKNPMPIPTPTKTNKTDMDGSASPASSDKVLQPRYKPNTTPPVLDVPEGYHLVQSGDYLYKIASQYNTTIEKIMYWNKMKDDKLSLNQLIKITGDDNYVDNNPVARIDEAEGVKYTVHVVCQNDKLASIARRYNTTLAELYALNNLQSDFLQIKQEIIVAKEQLP